MLKTFLTNNQINHKFTEDSVLHIGTESFDVVEPINGKLFDDKFHFVHGGTDCDNYVFKFGSRWYWMPKGCEENPQLNDLKYLGWCETDIPTKAFLGVHGCFELLNGSRLYTDWVRKAKFLGVEYLGICEHNTLAGIIKFQEACLSEGITPVIGETLTVKRGALTYDIKCYVKNKQGWENLLQLNKAVNVTNDGYVDETELFSHEKGLILVVDPKNLNHNDLFPHGLSRQVFYQLDTVEYAEDTADSTYLRNLKKYAYDKELSPISICDAYYLDKEDAPVKTILNTVRGKFELRTINQYFKSKEDYFLELDGLIKNDDRLYHIYETAVNNEIVLAARCRFTVETGVRHLPKYEMTAVEKAQYDTNEDLFWGIIENGLRTKVPPAQYDEYLGRLDKEYGVIQMGDVLDYFLTLHDIIQWAHRNGIKTGIGRGSAGGSLISFLMGLIYVNPMEFGLLFERFLNEGRIKKSLPDIDTDFPGKARPRVKAYIEQRFGETQVCSVGTYTNMKLRGAIKELARIEGVPFQDANRVTKYIADNDKTLEDLFTCASKNKTVSTFIRNYPQIINFLPLLLNQPKARSIHACAMIIFPKEKDMYTWSPIREQDGQLVSEWEGNEMELAGFLKEDILGIAQLDKFVDILDLIKKNTGEIVDMYTLPLDDATIYEYFCNGWNGDVFHFGSHGLTSYCKELQPTNIEDLIAGISLYRPGAMENNFHNEYIKRKNGERDIEYFVGTENILSATYGVFVYQEQIMELCRVLGGLSLVEADDVRKAMVKKKFEELTKYRDKFIPYYVKTFNVDQAYAESVWDAIDKASTYLFNRSHATAYTLTGYISQYFKVHYPLEYWSIAIKYAKEEQIPNFIAEIKATSNIEIKPPDINYSGTHIVTNFEHNSIYWGLSSIKNVGEVATEQIMVDRKKYGEYFTFAEFIDRHKFKGSKVNKRIIENLILSGAFDNLVKLETPVDRQRMIDAYRSTNKVRVNKDKDLFALNNENLDRRWWWTYQQKALSGLAFFNYDALCRYYLDADIEYIDPVRIQELNEGRMITVGGYVVLAESKGTRKGTICKIVLESNYEFIDVLIWNDIFELNSDVLSNCEKSILLLSGVVKQDSYKGKRVIHTNKTSLIKILKNK